ncbi:MAPEG family protein [Brevundimonas sp. Root1423]|uniref:MAPEG family protein n=1 Tax=Brevundimonas sp. Root1423 TaxID=1736462 RepID=UPI000700CDC8|nr:MAPEG family protein [Brevundimonas sp. Root1423]KQY75279.1 hypothetical protein ASD25_12075 [Brevundimonas sp. Root1423]
MSLVIPFLVQIALTLATTVLLAGARWGALKRREVRMSAIAISNDAWPKPVRLLTNNYANQFESPVLFYALILMALHLGATGIGMVVAAWVFVASRIGHSLVHLNGNNVRRRFYVFGAGVFALAAMAAQLALAIVSAP